MSKGKCERCQINKYEICTQSNSEMYELHRIPTRADQIEILKRETVPPCSHRAIISSPFFPPRVDSETFLTEALASLQVCVHACEFICH